MRKKVAIYIDYTIRVPNFIAAYNTFKAELFSDKASDVTFDDEIQENDVRMFWLTVMKNPEIESFYLKVKMPKDDYSVREVGMASFFYDETHYSKFLEEYSYNLYVDCDVPDRSHITIINTAQSQLFDVVLVDEVTTKRKVSNTFFFLSKNALYPQSVLLLDKGQEINPENYIGIWNPKKNMEQKNALKDTSFLDWFMKLEKESKENGTS